MSTITAYTTDYCSYCRTAKALLARRGISYREIDVTHDDSRRQWLVARTGRRTVPQIFLADEPIGGFDELSALDASGELARRLEKTKVA
jgi:glutaredoxin 3